MGTVLLRILTRLPACRLALGAVSRMVRTEFAVPGITFDLFVRQSYTVAAPSVVVSDLSETAHGECDVRVDGDRRNMVSGK